MSRRHFGRPRPPVQPNAEPPTRYLRARANFRDGVAAIEAGRLEDGRNLLKLALSWLAESRDDEAPKLTADVRMHLGDVDRLLGLADTEAPPATLRSGLARTEPSDMELLAAMVDERKPLEEELEAARKGRTGS